MQVDELGLIPQWNPPRRDSTENWDISTHYFASYSKRQKPLNPGERPSTKSDLGNLVVVANRYLPRNLPSNVGSSDKLFTLVLAHSCGAHKESWEPTLAYLYRLAFSSSSSYKIGEVWAMEPVHHGDAGWLNRTADLIVDAMNYPVDLIEFVERRIPLQVTMETLPAYLPRHELHRRANIIGIGHSFGAQAIIHAALHSPTLFTQLILIEPGVTDPTQLRHRPFLLASAANARRKDVFTSRSAVINHLENHPVYKTWTPEIIRLYAQYAVAPLSDGTLTLKLTRAHESILTGLRAPYDAVWYCLRSIPAFTSVFFVYGSKSLVTPQFIQKLTPKEIAHSKTLSIDGGHMLVQENPEELAACVHQAIVGLDGRTNNSSQVRTKM